MPPRCLRSQRRDADGRAVTTDPGRLQPDGVLARARSQMASVADQGIEVASPRIGMKLLNVQIAPFGDRSTQEGRMLVTLQERALAERLRGQSLFHGAARSISAMVALLAHEVKNPLAGIKGGSRCRSTCRPKIRNSRA